MHEQVHDQTFRESRGDRLTVRGLSIHSAQLGISGQCDAVEFFRDPEGVPLRDREGLWLPYPVEYKRGKPKEHNADALQLCAQAMCLEEMLCCAVPEGRFTTENPAAGAWSSLRLSCAGRSGIMRRRCMSCIRDAIPPGSSPRRPAMCAL